MANKTAQDFPILLEPDPQKKATFAEIHRFTCVNAHYMQLGCFTLQIRFAPHQYGEEHFTAHHVFADLVWFGDVETE